MCPPSSREVIVSIRHLVYVTVVTFPEGHPHTVTYTICRIDTITSPDDGHIAVRKV